MQEVKATAKKRLYQGSDSSLSDQALLLARILAGLGLLIPTFAIVGWVFEIPLLKNGHASFPLIQPNAAVGLILAGLAILLSSNNPMHNHGTQKSLGLRYNRQLSYFLALGIFFLGFFTLSEYLVGINLGIDHIFKAAPPTPIQPFPGRPSPQTAVNFVIFGLALVLNLLRLLPVRIAQVLVFFVILNALVSLTGRLMSKDHFYGYPMINQVLGMTLHGAASFILLGLSFLLIRPRDGLMTLVTSPTLSGRRARRILVSGLVIPPLLALITRVGVSRGWYGIRFQMTFFNVTAFGLILMALWKVFRESEFEELRAEAALADSHEAKERLATAKMRFELTLSGANLGTWDWDIPTGQFRFNARWAEIRGYTLEEIHPHVDFWVAGIHPDDVSRVQKAINDYFRGHRNEYKTKHRVRTKTGEWIWVLEKGKVFERDDKGHPLRMAGTVSEIDKIRKSDRKERTGQKKINI